MTNRLVMEKHLHNQDPHLTHTQMQTHTQSHTLHKPKGSPKWTVLMLTLEKMEPWMSHSCAILGALHIVKTFIYHWPPPLLGIKSVPKRICHKQTSSVLIHWMWRRLRPSGDDRLLTSAANTSNEHNSCFPSQPIVVATALSLSGGCDPNC